jgi:D-ribose pyranose/furanose isomerase RbsD
LNTPQALNLCPKPQALRLSLWRPHYRRTLEHELPIFLNLLQVTTETGLTLPQSLKCLDLLLDIGCPHLVKTFATVLELANATNILFHDALIEASKEAKVDSVANLMTALAVPTETPAELLSIISAQTAIAHTLHGDRLVSLSKNYWRRWIPHVLFFTFFVFPLIVVPMLGPALQSTALAYQQTYSRNDLIDTALHN